MRNAAINTLLVIASLGFVYGALEIGLRVVHYPRHEARMLCLDPVVHNVFCPNVTTLYGDTHTPVSTNRYGMADRDYPIAKPAGTIRVTLLGDSVTASLFTRDGHKFEQLWEDALTRHFGRPVEVLNFGLDGTGTWEQVQLFHLRARAFSPDYAVLAFFWGNDVWNNFASLEKGRPNPLKDEYDTSRAIVAFKVAHRNAIRWLWNHSAAFQFLDILKDTVETKLDYERALRPSNAQSSATAAERHDPALDWNSEAWDLTRKLMLKLRAECDAAHTKLIVFGIPMLDQITRPQPLPYRELRAFLDANGIVNIDAFDEIAKLDQAQKKALYLGDDTHLSDQGHRFFARATLPRLEALLATPSTATLAGEPK